MFLVVSDINLKTFQVLIQSVNQLSKKVKRKKEKKESIQTSIQLLFQNKRIFCFSKNIISVH